MHHTITAGDTAFLQEHHSAREVFLTEQTAQAEAGSLIRPAQVCTASQYSQAEGDDVFVCKYEYNMANQVS